MKIFFYAGRNEANLSRISSKLWKIERVGRRVTVWWGPAKFERKKRKYAAIGRLQTKPFRFDSAEDAEEFEAGLIRRKLNSGYERNPRRKPN